jgi:hypothetical protein
LDWDYELSLALALVEVVGMPETLSFLFSVRTVFPKGEKLLNPTAGLALLVVNGGGGASTLEENREIC